MGSHHQPGGIHHFKGTGSGADKYYCARVLGMDLIPGSDGQCGPNNGPQCAECRAYQAAQVGGAGTGLTLTTSLLTPTSSTVSLPLQPCDRLHHPQLRVVTSAVRWWAVWWCLPRTTPATVMRVEVPCPWVKWVWWCRRQGRVCK